MISYCIAAYRPTYTRLLLADLVEKTSTSFEILVWLNVADATLDADIATAMAQGVPLCVVGRTPENFGMRAYAELFRAARYPLITQIDDDVVRVSRGIAERAARLFDHFLSVRQLVADVRPDEHTTSACPLPAFDRRQGLYHGPIAGWFSVYHQSILPLLLGLPFAPYFALGGTVPATCPARTHALLDLGMKVFHVIGRAYADAFGMLEVEIEKYRRLGRFRSWLGTKATATQRPQQGTLQPNSGDPGVFGPALRHIVAACVIDEVATRRLLPRCSRSSLLAQIR
jgi:hypothetical protein